METRTENRWRKATVLALILCLLLGTLAVWLRFKPVGEFARMLLPRAKKRSPRLARPVEWLFRRCSK